MALLSGVKFRCYPTIEQEEALSSWIDCQRYIYNAKVGEYRYFETFRNKSLSLTGHQIPVDQRYSRFKDKELTPFLYQDPSQILRNGATRFMMAYSVIPPDWRTASIQKKPGQAKRLGHLRVLQIHPDKEGERHRESRGQRQCAHAGNES